MKSVTFTGVLIIFMVTTFFVGRSYGLKTAPEYVAMKDRERDRVLDDIRTLNAEYEGSTDDVCQQIMDLVLDHMADMEEPPRD